MMTVQIRYLTHPQVKIELAVPCSVMGRERKATLRLAASTWLRSHSLTEKVLR
jgi:hypothetical protein